MNKRKILAVIGIVIVIILAVAFSAAKDKRRTPFLLKSQQPWYAVHLGNGQTYFGHPAAITPDTITLADTFLMEVYTAPASQTASSTSFQLQNIPQQVYSLTRRGESDNMQTDNILFIDRHSVLFWEKLNTASEMAKWLEKAGTARK